MGRDQGPGAKYEGVSTRRVMRDRSLHCLQDWLLGIVYRGTAGFVKDAAGLGPVPFIGVENINLTSLIQVGISRFKEFRAGQSQQPDLGWNPWSGES